MVICAIGWWQSYGGCTMVVWLLFLVEIAQGIVAVIPYVKNAFNLQFPRHQNAGSNVCYKSMTLVLVI